MDDEEDVLYRVVINDEEQYSIMPVGLDNPVGWRDVGKQGRKQDCLSFIDDVWSDMRPLSVRRHMDGAG